MHPSIINSPRKLETVVLSFPIVFTLLKAIDLSLGADAHISSLALSELLQSLTLCSGYREVTAPG